MVSLGRPGEDALRPCRKKGVRLMPQRTVRQLFTLVILAAAFFGLPSPDAGRAAPAPKTDDGRREPTKAELEAAKEAYKALGVRYEARPDYWPGGTLHVFCVGGLTAEIAKQLPDLPFNYMLDFGGDE